MTNSSSGNEAKSLGKGTIEYRNRMAATMKKPDAAIAMVEEAMKPDDI